MAFRFVARLVVPIVILAVGLLLLGGVAAWYLHRLQREASQLLVASVARVLAAEELELIGFRLRAGLHEYLLTGDRTMLADVPNLQHEAAGWIKEAKTLANDEQEAELVAKIEEGYNHFLSEYQEIQRDPPSDQERRAILRLVQHLAKDEILRPAADYRDLNRKQMVAASQRDQTIADRTGLTLLLLGMCGAVSGLLGGFGIARGIQRSMVQLAVPIRDATGKLEEVVGPITVISDPSFAGMETALQHLSDKVGAMVERLHESHLVAARAEQLAAVGQLAAGLAHELRNPLTSMKVLVQGAREQDGAGGLQGRDLAIVEEEINRLSRTIQTFLDYARPPIPEKSRFAIRDVLEQTISLVSAQAKQLGVRIATQQPLPNPLIEADEAEIRQVLLNLMINALEATAEGGTITVGIDSPPPTAPDAPPSVPAPSAGCVRIQIADTGAGLPVGLGERIFEPFVSTKETGTGLGLAICKRIVEEHGGFIEATSRTEGGALFTVSLPVDNISDSCPVEDQQPSALP